MHTTHCYLFMLSHFKYSSRIRVQESGFMNIVGLTAWNIVVLLMYQFLDHQNEF